MTDQLCEELQKALRAQRHEFINHLQVIHAMLQLGRNEKALRYIEELAKDPSLADPVRLHRDLPACTRKSGL